MPTGATTRSETGAGMGQHVEEMLFAGNSAKQQLLAVIPFANFIIFRDYVSVTEGMQEPA